MSSEPTATTPSEPRVWDPRHQLATSARGALERHLLATERKAGVPLRLSLAVTDHLHGESVGDWAARAFAERNLGDDPSRNAVLLAVALDSGAAAVETGKGSAGIVPEIDARRIVKELSARLSARHPEPALAAALTQLAASARETAARRTPTPKREAPEEAPLADASDAGTGPGGDAAPAPEAAGTRSVPEGGDGGAPRAPGNPAGGKPARSRLPVAIGLGVLVLLGLALRRRRQIAASRPDDTPDRPADRRRLRP